MKRALTRRRALFNVPGSDPKKLAKIPSLLADSIVLDLEDGVSLNKKAEARKLVSSALKNTKFNGEKAVRINSVGSGLAKEDLESILDTNLQALVIPKVESPEDLYFVKEIFKDKSVSLLACIESALSLQRIDKIAQVDGLDALVFASEDYCADTGITRTDSLRELLFARSVVVNAAKAYDLQAIDLVCLDFKNPKRLEWECEDGKIMGFTGKQAIHPNQIEIIQKIFQPSETEVFKAKEIIKKFNAHEKQGIGAFDFEGKVVDMPVAKVAKKVLITAGYSDEDIKSL